MHTMFYSSEVTALRAFIRDRLGLPATDVGGGWLIFDIPEADMGCHPADGRPSGTHYVSFYCDDIDSTVVELGRSDALCSGAGAAAENDHGTLGGMLLSRAQAGHKGLSGTPALGRGLRIERRPAQNAAMSDSQYDIRVVDASHEPILRNMLEHYCHDMAEWFLFEADAAGTYGYPTEHLWDAGRYVYLAYASGVPIAFALVGPADDYTDRPGGRDLREFFVVRRHRRSGLGQRLAMHVWDAHPGPWLVRVFQGNRPAIPFWRATVETYTRGAYREDEREISDRRWSFFSFNSRTSSPDDV